MNVLTSDTYPKFVSTVIAIAFFLLAIQSLMPQTARAQIGSPWRVSVTVAADDAIQNEVLSYMDRELRDLNDIAIVDSNATFRIEVLATLNYIEESSTPIGVTISYLITEPILVDRLKSALLTLVDTANAEMIVDIFAGGNRVQYEHILRHKIIMGANDDLQIMCQKVVTDFDASFMISLRKSYRELKNAAD